jgi:hypothetical protein
VDDATGQLETALFVGKQDSYILPFQRSRLDGVWHLFCNRTVQCNPVVTPPTKCATDRPHGNETQQAIKQARLSLFEFDGIASWTFTLNPQQVR